MTAADGQADIAALYARCESAVTAAFRIAEWGYDEITRAQQRHPGRDDLLWHASELIRPTHDMIASTEFVYRGHARELLERVALGEDTRPGSAAECCVVCCNTSALAPFNQAGTGLYLRMWVQAFPGVDPFGDIASELDHHEKSWVREETDRLERLLRRRLVQPWRRLDPEAITCPGAHDGKPVVCRFTPDTLF
jgi:hypothetical protein